MREVEVTKDCVAGAYDRLDETAAGLELILAEGKTEISFDKFGTANALSFDLNVANVAGRVELCFEQQFADGSRNGIWLDVGPDGKASLQAGTEEHDRLTLAYTTRPTSPVSGKQVRNLYPGTEAIGIALGQTTPCLFSVDFCEGTGCIHYLARIGERVFEYFGRNTGSLKGAEYRSSVLALTQPAPGGTTLAISGFKVAEKPAERSSLETPAFAAGEEKTGYKREYCMMLGLDTDVSSWDRDFADMSNLGLTHVCPVDTRHAAITPDVFDLHDAAIERAAAQGLKSYLCVYTCGRPFMLGQKGFEAQPMVNFRGDRHEIIENLWDLDWQETGGLRKYLSAVAEHYAGNSDVAGYIIDEPLREWVKAPEQGYDPVCRGQFAAFLREKYGSIKRLNERWESSFDAWENVSPPTPDEAEKLPARWSDWQEARCTWSTGFFVNMQKHLKAPDATKRIVWSVTVPASRDQTLKEREENCVNYDAVIPLLDSVLFTVTIPGEAEGMDPAIKGILDRRDLAGKDLFAAHCWFSIHHGGDRPSPDEARRRLNAAQELFPHCHWYGWAYKQCGPFDMGLQDDISLWPEHKQLLAEFISACEGWKG